jgi:hypothetical protein
MNRHFRRRILCNARDHQYGRCTLVAGHGGGRWHAEIRRGRLWAEWRGPIPGERCGICGTDHRPEAAEIIRKADALPAAPGPLATKGTDQ